MDIHITDPMLLEDLIKQINLSYEAAHKSILGEDKESQTYKRKLAAIKSVFINNIKSKVVVFPNDIKENISLQMNLFNPKASLSDPSDEKIEKDSEIKYRETLNNIKLTGKKLRNMKSSEVNEQDLQEIQSDESETAKEFKRLEETNTYVNKRLELLTAKLAMNQTEFPASDVCNKEKFQMTQILYSLCGNK